MTLTWTRRIVIPGFGYSLSPAKAPMLAERERYGFLSRFEVQLASDLNSIPKILSLEGRSAICSKEACFVDRLSIVETSRYLLRSLRAPIDLMWFGPTTDRSVPGWTPEPGYGLTKLMELSWTERIVYPLTIHCCCPTNPGSLQIQIPSPRG